MSRLFKSMDTDDDYELTLDEIRSLIEKLDHGQFAAHIEDNTLKTLFDRADLNKDGKL